VARPHPDKMTFLEHLDELRARLVRAAIALVVGFGVCWGFREQIFHFMTQPMRAAGYEDAFIFTGTAEAFMLYMKMAFFVGIFVASPYWLWQAWAFIAPGLGLAFQIPVVIFVLARIGLVTPRFLLKGWKLAVLGSFVLAAVITPTPDVVNQTVLAVPLIGLYFLGVGVAWAFGRKRRVPKSTAVSVKEARS
jgi:Sec-independent protein secretion pathway component TatC